MMDKQWIRHFGIGLLVVCLSPIVITLFVIIWIVLAVARLGEGFTKGYEAGPPDEL